MAEKTNRKKRKKILLGLIITILIILLAGVGYTYYLINTAEQKLEKTYKPFKGKTNQEDIIEATKPMTILLMGVDTGSEERKDTWEGNSDSMIVMTINPKTKKTSMTSLERDILTEIDDNGTKREAKLNSAYQTGGIELATSTIEKLLNVEFDHYMLINMKGLIQLVDAVGGIEVNNELGFPISIAENEPEFKATVEPGQQHINGEQALVYSRMRYQDPEGDYGRQKRQREVIKAIIKKMLSLDGLNNYNKILEAISNNIQTDIPLNSSNLLKLMGYKDSLNNIEQFQLTGTDSIINGVSYQIADSENLLDIQNKIRKEIDKETLTDLKSNAIINGKTSNQEQELETTNTTNNNENTSTDESYFTYQAE